MFNRLDRINSLIRNEISIIISREIKDPRINIITITSVKTCKDLSLSKVFFSSVNEGDKDKILEGLNSASGFIRNSLKKKLALKRIPVLTFIYDSSMEYGDRIEKILKTLNDEKSEE